MVLQSGKLVVFEGVARSGKSTLIQLLSNRMKEKGYRVALTEWNSYLPLQELINHKKTYFTFTPLTYSLLHLAEFSLRYEEMIKPALCEGQIVIADRWVYTALTRDVVRGISSDYVRHCYKFARKPDIVFYVEVPFEEAYQRHLKTKQYFGYNSGTDIWTNCPVEESFRQYHGQLTEVYSKLSEEENFIRLNGLMNPNEIIDHVCSHLSMKCGIQL